MALHCTECGFVNDEGANYCQRCGALMVRAELVNRLRKKHEGGEVMITGDDVQRLTDILAHRQPEAPTQDGQS